MAIKIYFLDDETDILEIFKDTFSSNEFIITTFSNPTDLIEASKIDKPDLYFLDNKLPNSLLILFQNNSIQTFQKQL
ncbi:hypothetical protein [Silvanigrella sp.]|jgi:DNA-binding NtrC family response regulator|uniref:hypothetical protein n=1 Tax=Silvanigrella sp. TaxID=2024976 RepID=UPI0037C5CAF8